MVRIPNQHLTKLLLAIASNRNSKRSQGLKFYVYRWKTIQMFHNRHPNP